MMKVDMTRGKPSEEQLSLSVPMEHLGAHVDPVFQGIDVRNYGCLEGLPAAREFLGRIAQVSPDNMIAWGNSSLTLMFLYARFLVDDFRLKNPGKTPKWIANTPGYDRHFAITEELGIELISVPMASDGPDVAKIREIISRDESVIGMWCVPKHSNPCGTTYSDQRVRQCAALPKSGGEAFTIFWDNAYGIHDFQGKAQALLPLMAEAEREGTENQVVIFCSTSKITFAGGGIAGMGLSVEKRGRFLKHLNAMSICCDKVAQLRHVRFFEEPGSLEAHMQKQAQLMEPKFHAVSSTFREILSDVSGVSWSAPQGGYFISLYLPQGTASQVCKRAAEKGISLTKAGSAYPYGKDPNDGHLRIAPSYPSLKEIQHAARIIAETVREVVVS
jgi:DNA-binding transcriptional MocR family regulator